MTARERNRAAMPATAAIVDELRAVFGPPAYGHFAEAGRTITWGAPLHPDAVPVAPATLPSSGPWHKGRPGR